MTDSLLAGLLARRDEIAATLTETVPVPEWTDPTISLRMRPVDHARIKQAQTAAESAGRRKKADAELDALAQIVAASVVRVVVGGDRELSLKDFGEAILGDDATGAKTVRAICIRDGDLIALADKVADLSGYQQSLSPVDEQLQGD